MNHKLRLHELEELHRLIEAGKNVTEIEAAIGIKPSTVRYYQYTCKDWLPIPSSQEWTAVLDVAKEYGYRATSLAGFLQRRNYQILSYRKVLYMKIADVEQFIASLSEQRTSMTFGEVTKILPGIYYGTLLKYLHDGKISAHKDGGAYSVDLDTLKKELTVLGYNFEDHSNNQISIHEASKLLEVSPQSLYDYVNTGRVTTYQHGTRMKVDFKELCDELLEIGGEIVREAVLRYREKPIAPVKSARVPKAIRSKVIQDLKAGDTVLTVARNHQLPENYVKNLYHTQV